jgi:hypothetical protein
MLRRIVLLALAVPAPGVAACRVVEGRDPPSDAAADRGPEGDAGPEDADAGTDADVAPPDAGTDSCEPFFIDGSVYDEPPDACVVFRQLPCGVPADAQVSDCYPDLPLCGASCGGGFLLYCLLAPGTCGDGGIVPDAAVVLECISCTAGGGRRPRGLCAPLVSRRAPLGDYFAAMAHLESASVRAFRDLERWLVAEGAPPHLAGAARRAAGDERRHARAVAGLARRFGGAPPRPRVARRAWPTLFEVLEDDVVEGLVGETFGALLATWQAERAGDARVRRTMRAIARDETRHAALAWEILIWGAARLGPDERDQLQRALAGALTALERRVSTAVPEAVQRVSGHPAPEAARRLVHGLASLVHREAAAPLAT